jgi:hypothetical protein
MIKRRGEGILAALSSGPLRIILVVTYPSDSREGSVVRVDHPPLHVIITQLLSAPSPKISSNALTWEFVAPQIPHEDGDLAIVRIILSLYAILWVCLSFGCSLGLCHRA